MKLTRRNTIRSSIAGIVAGSFLKTTGIAPVAASDPTEESWTQFGYDVANTGNGSENSSVIATDAEPGNGVGFEFGMDFETEAWGSVGTPIVYQGTAYVVSGSELAAFDIESGRREWSFYGEANLFGSSPTLAEGHVYIHDSGSVASIDADNGTERWRYETAQFASLDYSPIVSDGVLYGTDSRSTYALDAENGNEIWSEDYRSDSGGIAIWNDIAYLLDDTFEEEQAVALSLDDGSEHWSVPLEGMEAYSCPTVAEGVVVFSLRQRFGEEGSGLYAFDADTGDKLWDTVDNFNNERPVSSPAIKDGLVITWSSEEGLIAVDLVDGNRVWTVAGSSGYSSRGSPAPIIVNDTVYVNDWGSNLSAYNLSDGTELWTLPLPESSGSADISSPTISNERVYIAATGSRLFRVDREQIFAVYPNRLYVVSEDGRSLPEVRIDYSPSPPVTGDPIEFSATVIDDQEGDEWEYKWGIADGDESFEYSGQTISHEFTTAGEGSVRVGITNDERLGTVARRSFDIEQEDEQEGEDGEQEDEQEEDEQEGEDGEEEEQVVSDEIPGFGFGSTLTALGGTGYMLKRRLEDDSPD